MSTLMNWVKTGLTKPGKSQRGLAKALDIDPAAINRMLQGKRQLKLDELSKIAGYLEEPVPDLGLKLERDALSQQSVDGGSKPTLRSVPGEPGVDTWKRDLRVLGFVKAGKVGYYPDNGETLEMTKRPPMLEGVPDHLCYAVIVDDVSMVPALKPGYTAWVHVRWPAQPGDNIIIQMNDGQAFVKELVRRTERFLICKQWNPLEDDIKFEWTKVKAVHLVVGSGRGIR